MADLVEPARYAESPARHRWNMREYVQGRALRPDELIESSTGRPDEADENPYQGPPHRLVLLLPGYFPFGRAGPRVGEVEVLNLTVSEPRFGRVIRSLWDPVLISGSCSP